MIRKNYNSKPIAIPACLYHGIYAFMKSFDFVTPIQWIHGVDELTGSLKYFLDLCNKISQKQNTVISGLKNLQCCSARKLSLSHIQRLPKTEIYTVDQGGRKARDAVPWKCGIMGCQKEIFVDAVVTVFSSRDISVKVTQWRHTAPRFTRRLGGVPWVV